jgi:hypothetical protein
MAVIVFTPEPDELLASVVGSIEDGSIRTWSHDADGDFTHSASQWTQKAWLRPRLEDGKLILNIFPPRGKTLGRAIYGVYHGRFIEMLLNHFDERFERAIATALPDDEDRTKG